MRYALLEILQELSFIHVIPFLKASCEAKLEKMFFTLLLLCMRRMVLRVESFFFSACFPLPPVLQRVLAGSLEYMNSDVTKEKERKKGSWTAVLPQQSI